MRLPFAFIVASAAVIVDCQAYDRGRYGSYLDSSSDAILADSTRTETGDASRDAFDSAIDDATDATETTDATDVIATDVPRDVSGDATACSIGATRGCYSGTDSTRGVGACHPGTQTCGAGGSWSTVCAGEALPAAREFCGDLVDDNCNGTLDDGCPLVRSCMSPSVAGCGFIEVPGGTFDMGEVAGWNSDPIQPGLHVAADVVWDSYEVTVARFRTFWSATHPTSGSVTYPNGAHVPFATTLTSLTVAAMNCNWTDAVGTREAHPMNCIDWNTAQAFCAWDGGRLPTETEFEWVTRFRPLAGVTPGRLYPWGDDPPTGTTGGTCTHTQFAFCHGDDGALSRRVGSFPATGQIYDLVGNISEWMADEYLGYTDARCWNGTASAHTDPLCIVGSTSHTRRSGSFGSPIDRVHASARDSVPGVSQYDYIGVRCVRDR